MVAKGYPHNIANGMNEFASHAGFSADSTLLAYCFETDGIGGTRCEVLARDGSRRTMESNEGERLPNGKPDPKELAKRKDIDKFLADQKITALSRTTMSAAGPHALGPALTGRWPFTDIILDVVRIEASGQDPKTGVLVHPAHVRIGGSVAGEKAVHPVALVANRVPLAPPHWATLNAMQISPNEAEIGFVMNTFACEYCIDFELRRMPVGALASLIYNDTGFRHHQKKEWRESAALFEKALAADETAKLPAYNLACAWARLGDPRMKDALAYAMTLDPTVRERAQKDEDFASVRSEPWFPVP